MERLLLNKNGRSYCIIDGKVFGPAILVDMNSNDYVVTSFLTNYEWLSGSYFNNINDALKFWKKIKKGSKPTRLFRTFR